MNCKCYITLRSKDEEGSSMFLLPSDSCNHTRANTLSDSITLPNGSPHAQVYTIKLVALNTEYRCMLLRQSLRAIITENKMPTVVVQNHTGKHSAAKEADSGSGFCFRRNSSEISLKSKSR